jgi:hypothetical protein
MHVSSQSSDILNGRTKLQASGLRRITEIAKEWIVPGRKDPAAGRSATVPLIPL